MRTVKSEEKMNYSEINSCIVCGGEKFEPIFCVNDICLTGVFPKADQVDPIKTPITVQKCVHCNNVQMREKVNPELMFRDYWYRSSTTKSMVAHLRATLSRVAKDGGLLLDIGCNDGTLMELAAENGMDVYGVDPSEAANEAKKKFNDRVFTDFFTKDLVLSSLSDKHDSFSLVTAISMFYDVPDPVEFLSGIELLLREDGVALIEVNYAKSFFERSNVDMLGQEHLIYYFISTFQKVLDKTNLNLYDAYLTDMNGGNIAFLISKKELPRSLRLIELMEEEEKWISTFNFKKFESDVMKSFSTFKLWLLKTSKNKSIKILGASKPSAAYRCASSNQAW
ncbi:MAG: methyltransferase domain-containing protein [Betaproteobacteria bacterium]|nr:methyltransferase domain-containing protein [Betaproteobacteria bacterium]